jgi:hypothetical protein
MKANELRIGSIVKSLVNDEDYSIVEEIGHRASLGHYVSLNNQHSGVWLVHQERELILGIPLTEEWLLKFGFEKDDVFDKFFTYLPIHDLCMDKLSFRVNEGFICYESIKYRTLLKHIQYVHQLQNLYFALTNEELTMK